MFVYRLSVTKLTAYSFIWSFKSQHHWLKNDALISSSWISLEMLCSKVMPSFAYCKSHRPCYSKPELIPSMVYGYKVTEKPNWNASECIVVRFFLSFLGVVSISISIYFERQGPHYTHVHHAYSTSCRLHTLCTEGLHFNAFMDNGNSGINNSMCITFILYLEEGTVLTQKKWE